MYVCSQSVRMTRQCEEKKLQSTEIGWEFVYICDGYSLKWRRLWLDRDNEIRIMGKDFNFHNLLQITPKYHH